MSWNNLRSPDVMRSAQQRHDRDIAFGTQLACESDIRRCVNALERSQFIVARRRAVLGSIDDSYATGRAPCSTGTIGAMRDAELAARFENGPSLRDAQG